AQAVGQHPGDGLQVARLAGDRAEAGLVDHQRRERLGDRVALFEPDRPGQADRRGVDAAAYLAYGVAIELPDDATNLRMGLRLAEDDPPHPRGGVQILAEVAGDPAQRRGHVTVPDLR